jgi:hypothetical protein
MVETYLTEEEKQRVQTQDKNDAPDVAEAKEVAHDGNGSKGDADRG